jgi:hypothetical protein
MAQVSHSPVIINSKIGYDTYMLRVIETLLPRRRFLYVPPPPTYTHTHTHTHTLLSAFVDPSEVVVQWVAVLPGVHPAGSNFVQMSLTGRLLSLESLCNSFKTIFSLSLSLRSSRTLFIEEPCLILLN